MHRDLPEFGVRRLKNVWLLPVIAIVITSFAVHVPGDPVPSPEFDGRAKKQVSKSDEPGTISTEITVRYQLKSPTADAANAARCKANVEISYVQMNARIRVDTAISNHDCAASHGGYQLQIRTKDSDGASAMRSFSETWTRDDDADLNSEKFYDMAGHVELVWARVNRVSCTCTALADPPP